MTRGRFAGRAQPDFFTRTPSHLSPTPIPDSASYFLPILSFGAAKFLLRRRVQDG